MSLFRARKILVSSFPGIVLGFLVCAGAAYAQAPKITTKPAVPTSASSGKEMFTEYCAVCHGTDGAGTGPAAAALTKKPANLTVLSKNNGGKFPDMKVYNTIRGDSNAVAHGTKDMPIWGNVFREMSIGNTSATERLRLANLTAYVQSLQQ